MAGLHRRCRLLPALTDRGRPPHPQRHRLFMLNLFLGWTASAGSLLFAWRFFQPPATTIRTGITLPRLGAGSGLLPGCLRNRVLSCAESFMLAGSPSNILLRLTLVVVARLPAPRQEPEAVRPGHTLRAV